VKKKLLPKVKSLTTHSDVEIATAANYVLKEYKGSLPYGTWNTYGQPNWNDFKR
jgi:hypothetical protein